jgi:hypothetical protein
MPVVYSDQKPSTNVPLGLCQCGCGQSTNIALQTVPENGHIKGQHMRYLRYHRKNVWIVNNQKICTDCQEWRDLSLFDKSPRTSTGLVSRCKRCQSRRYKKMYIENKEKITTKRLERTNRVRDTLWEIIDKSSCCDCGEISPLVLEFDHIKGKKEFSIADLVSNGGPIERLLEEVSKCEIVCANCHWLRESMRKNSWRCNPDSYIKNIGYMMVQCKLTYILSILKSARCLDCDNADYRIFEFDHVRGERVAGVFALARRNDDRWEDLESEIIKCDIVCRNCHTIRTAKNGNFWKWQRVTANVRSPSKII